MPTKFSRASSGYAETKFNPVRSANSRSSEPVTESSRFSCGGAHAVSGEDADEILARQQRIRGDKVQSRALGKFAVVRASDGELKILLRRALFGHAPNSAVATGGIVAFPAARFDAGGMRDISRTRRFVPKP